jgi:hypothetical protein
MFKLRAPPAPPIKKVLDTARGLNINIIKKKGIMYKVLRKPSLN